MSWMSEVAIYVEEARQLGLDLDVADFRVNENGQLTLDGMPAEQWIDAMGMDDVPPNAGSAQ